MVSEVMPTAVLHPVSAATLYLQHVASSDKSSPKSKPGNLVTGCRAIDEHALEGGLRYGTDSLVGLACEGNQPCDLATAISLSFLSTHLLPSLPPELSSEAASAVDDGVDGSKVPPPPASPHRASATPEPPPRSLAFYIHPPSHPFPAIQLHAALLSRVRRLRRAAHARRPFTHDGGYVYKRSGFGRFDDLVERMEAEKAEWRAEAEARWREVDGRMRGRDEAAVRRCMERVSVMGCFDLEGVLEGVGEVRQRMEGALAPPSLPFAGAPPTTTAATTAATAVANTTIANPVGGGVLGDNDDEPSADEGGGGGREIADSQASGLDDDDDDDGDEMMLDLAAAPAQASPPSPLVPALAPASAPRQAKESEASATGPPLALLQQPARPLPSSASASGPATSEADPFDRHYPSPSSTAQRPSHLLLLPHLPSFVSPAMHRDHTRAHALLVHLCRTLRALAAVHPLISVLGNNTVGQALNLASSSSSSSSSDFSSRRQRGKGSSPHHHHDDYDNDGYDGKTRGGGGGGGNSSHHHLSYALSTGNSGSGSGSSSGGIGIGIGRHKGNDNSGGAVGVGVEEAVSAFAAAGSLRPALGRTLAHLLDVSLLVTRARSQSVATATTATASATTTATTTTTTTTKRTKDEAAGSRGSSSSSSRRRQEHHPRNNYVLEVVKDRGGARVGGWGAFRVGDGGEEDNDGGGLLLLEGLS